MRKIFASLLLVGAAIGGPVAATSSASAEPSADTWYCTNAYEVVELKKTQFYGCPYNVISIVDSYTGNRKRNLDGMCANKLHQRNTAATWRDAYSQCVIKIF